jgi:alpha-galactosidase
MLRNNHRYFIGAAALSFTVMLGGLAFAAEPSRTRLAETPPMGWNSWDCYGTTVREEEVKANADYMAKNLARFGWQYMVVDIQWYTPNVKTHGYIPDPNNVVLDEFGRVTPAVSRFPSAARGVGFKALADYVHAKGLKFGIHIMRGIPRRAVSENLPIQGTPYHAGDVADKVHVCPWEGMVDMYGVDMSKPGGQAYYDSIATLYAKWGVDYVKADDMSQSFDPKAPYHADEIAGLSKALRKTGRPIVLSLSPGPTPIDQYDHLKKYVQLWRISNDFWDRWEDLKGQFALIHQWEPYAHPGGWPDADMLPLGRIGIRGERGNDRSSNFIHDEQRTLIALWCMFRSPLMFGGHLPSNDAFTLALITNPEVLAIDQDSSGNHQSYAQGDTIAWTADAPGKRGKYVAVFNIGDDPVDLDLSWADVGVKTGEAAVRDLWGRKDIGTAARLQTTLPPHASILYRVSPQ